MQWGSLYILSSRMETSTANDTPMTSGGSSDDWLVRVCWNFYRCRCGRNLTRNADVVRLTIDRNQSDVQILLYVWWTVVVSSGRRCSINQAWWLKVDTCHSLIRLRQTHWVWRQNSQFREWRSRWHKAALFRQKCFDWQSQRVNLHCLHGVAN